MVLVDPFSMDIDGGARIYIATLLNENIYMLYFVEKNFKSTSIKKIKYSTITSTQFNNSLYQAATGFIKKSQCYVGKGCNYIVHIKFSTQSI